MYASVECTAHFQWSWRNGKTEMRKRHVAVCAEEKIKQKAQVRQVHHLSGMYLCMTCGKRSQRNKNPGTRRGFQ